MKRNNSLQIIFINAHWNNRGDEASIRAMIDSFEDKLFAKKYMMILSKDISYFPFKDIGLLKWYPHLTNIMSFLSFIMDFLIAIITKGKLAFSKEGKEYIKTISTADMILHAPGGPNIGDYYTGRLMSNEIIYLYRFLIPIMLKKPIYLYAPSMGPFTGKIRNYIRKKILKNISLIIVRDPFSKKYMDNLGISSIETLDSSYQNEISENYLNKYDFPKLKRFMAKSKVIGLTIIDLTGHPLFHNCQFVKDYFNSISQLVQNLIQKEYNILLIPQLFGNKGSKELFQLKKIHKLNKDRIYILNPEFDAYALQLIISNLLTVISFRYHPNIFAAKNNIPFISISYEHKMNGFINKIELENLNIDICNANVNKIMEKLMYIEENYEQIVSHLKNRNKELKTDSQKTTKIIVDHFNNY